MTIEYKNLKDPSHISGFLKETLKSYTKTNSSGMTAIWDNWNDAVGEKIAENAQPAAFKGETLLVYVSSSTWMQHLSFLKNDIIDKINESLEEKSVKDIKFKIGNIQS
ncbi:MAG: DUF721 domain-containing protein [Desulfobacterales bacterium]|nr:DUF721 domain-containing protein [Desulfobacterales bacterium]